MSRRSSKIQKRIPKHNGRSKPIESHSVPFDKLTRIAARVLGTYDNTIGLENDVFTALGARQTRYASVLERSEVLKRLLYNRILIIIIHRHVLYQSAYFIFIDDNAVEFIKFVRMFLKSREELKT